LVSFGIAFRKAGRISAGFLGIYLVIATGVFGAIIYQVVQFYEFFKD
jgi:hypothetical protein